MGCGASADSSSAKGPPSSKAQPEKRKGARRRSTAQHGIDCTSMNEEGEIATGGAVLNPQNALYKGAWEERKDPTSGTIFYLNHETGEQTKTRPAEMDANPLLGQGNGKKKVLSKADNKRIQMARTCSSHAGPVGTKPQPMMRVKSF